MYKNYSQALQMQIPQENRYTGLEVMENTGSDLEKFLKSNFEIPSNNMTDIITFIHEDYEMEKIIYDLPEIISNEFPQSPILLDFVKFNFPNEKILKITIKTKFNVETSIIKENNITDYVLNEYKTTKNEFFIRVEPYD